MICSVIYLFYTKILADYTNKKSGVVPMLRLVYWGIRTGDERGERDRLADRLAW